MIGGGGERKTLRLVAQYADATNVFGGPTAIHHKYEVLARALRGDRPRSARRSSARRSSASISTAADSPAQIVDRFGELSDAGAQHVIFSVRTSTTRPISRSSAAMCCPQLRSL